VSSPLPGRCSRRAGLVPVALLLTLSVVVAGCGGGGDEPGARAQAESEATGVGTPLLVLGDSLTVGARLYGDLGDKLADAGWSPEITADDGEPVEFGLSWVRTLDSVPDVVVVGFGSNPGRTPELFRERAVELVDELTSRGAKTVVWWAPPEAGEPDRAQRAADLRAVAGGPLVVADWPAELAANPEWVGPDGIHYTDTGYAALADFLRRQLEPYTQAG
jgi:lysophospholipase L1-like esterase